MPFYLVFPDTQFNYHNPGTENFALMLQRFKSNHESPTLLNAVSRGTIRVSIGLGGTQMAKTKKQICIS
jgi:hypothetical protein